MFRTPISQRGTSVVEAQADNASLNTKQELREARRRRRGPVLTDTRLFTRWVGVNESGGGINRRPLCYSIVSG